MKAEGRPHLIHSGRPAPTEPFSCSGFGRAAQAKSEIQTVMPTEQDSLQGKGGADGFGLGVPVISLIIQARLPLVQRET